MRIKKDYVEYVGLAFVLGFVVLFVTGTLSSTFGYNLVVIQNADPNSMNPTYLQGDIFIIKKVNPDQIQLGDVIVYKNSRGTLIIHRVILIEVIEGKYYFVVKGDNPITNFSPDRDGSNDIFIPYDTVLGKTVFRIPMLGHISLAMQRNAAIQILIYIIAAIAGIGIIFWPEEKNEDEDEYYDFSKDSFHAMARNIAVSLGNFFPKASKISTEPKGKIIRFVTVMFILFMILLTYFSPGFLYNDKYDYKTGFVGMEVEEHRPIVSSPAIGNSQPSYVFFQLLVQLYDEGNPFEKIIGFEVQVFDSSNTEISYTVWNMKGRITGLFTVGASIIFDPTDMPSGAQTLRVVVTLQIQKMFTVQKILGETSFTYTK